MFDQATYNKAYYREHKQRIIEAERIRYSRRRSNPRFKARVKLHRELRHFGVPLSVIMRKTSGRCFFCGRKAQLGHHLDEDGRNNEASGEQPGHDVSRIVPVCRRCHIDLHRARLMLAKKTRSNGYWSRSFDRCIECGTSDRKHCGHGLCVNCAARRRRKEAGV